MSLRPSGAEHPGEGPGSGRCTAGDLHGLSLFTGLSADQVTRLCAQGSCRMLGPGWVYRQGEPAEELFVLLSGEVSLLMTTDGADLEISRSDRPGAHGGAVHVCFGEAGDRRTYINSMKALTSCRMFVLPAEGLSALMREWFPMAIHLGRGSLLGTQGALMADAQRERLLAMGTLAAGLTHELNNPAAAAVAATAALRNRVARMREKLGLLAASEHRREELARLLRLQEHAVEITSGAPTMSPIQAEDRQDDLVAWLEAHGIAEAWDLAPTFVQAGLGPDFLELVVDEVGAALLTEAVQWLNYTVETELLLDEVSESTARISSLVQGVGQYTQLDRAPFQVVDVHELLDATLMIFNHRIGAAAVEVVRDYDRALPPLPCYPAELNQVWTNLIDNALDAMEDHGVLTLRTARQDHHAVIEVADSGPGVPAELTSRIFDAFFTTKAFGAGTGLGLDVASRIVRIRHRGRITVPPQSSGGRFRVELPLVQPGAASA